MQVQNGIQKFNLNYELKGLQYIIKSKSPEDLKKLFPNGIPDLSTILTEEDFWNSTVFAVNRQIYKNKLNNLQDEGVIISTEPCTFCKSKRTRVQKKQTRSADEMVSTFIKCLDCSKTKKK